MKEVMPEKAVREVPGLPEKYTGSLKKAKGLNDCCRNSDNLSISTHKTQDGLRIPDLAILKCVCGRKHYRGASGPGRIG